jgi:two-component system chemotaxis response regulator CheY
MAEILIVDDSPSMRRMVSAALTEAGHKVREAEDGNKALALARSGAADLVVSDMNMPGMNGIELVGQLRSLPAYRTTPILMLTTETSEDMKGRARNAGANGWIVKPFDPDRLVGIVSRLLGVRPS